MVWYMSEGIVFEEEGTMFFFAGMMDLELAWCESLEAQGLKVYWLKSCRNDITILSYATPTIVGLSNVHLDHIFGAHSSLPTSLVGSRQP